jgi:hypothetical protein
MAHEYMPDDYGSSHLDTRHPHTPRGRADPYKTLGTGRAGGFPA